MKISSYFMVIMLLCTSFLVIIPNSVQSIDPPLSVPSCMRAGDLMFIESKHELGLEDIHGWDHIVMYTGVGHTFIESVPYPYCDGVQYTDLFVYQTWVDEVAFGYVATASESQRIGALNFAQSQLGQPYQNAHNESWHANANPDDPTDPYSDEWMCAELIWAAYLHQGINTDITPLPPPPEIGGDGIHLYVEPQDMADDDDVEMYTGDAPPEPNRPSGPTTSKKLRTKIYTASAIDPDDDDMYYQWDWGEYTGPWYLFPRGSGSTVVRHHTWLTVGTHNVRIRAKDIWGNVGEWSDPLTVTVTSGGGGGDSSFKLSFSVSCMIEDNVIQKTELNGIYNFFAL